MQVKRPSLVTTYVLGEICVTSVGEFGGRSGSGFGGVCRLLKSDDNYLGYRKEDSGGDASIGGLLIIGRMRLDLITSIKEATCVLD